MFVHNFLYYCYIYMYNVMPNQNLWINFNLIVKSLTNFKLIFAYFLFKNNLNKFVHHVELIHFARAEFEVGERAVTGYFRLRGDL